jgi:hypothetical protein
MRKRNPVNFEPGAMSVEDAAKYSGIGVDRMWDEVNSGKVDARKDGRRTLVLTSSLKARLEALPRR